MRPMATTSCFAKNLPLCVSSYQVQRWHYNGSAWVRQRRDGSRPRKRKRQDERDERDERGERERGRIRNVFPKRTQVGWSIRNRRPRVLTHGASWDSEVAFSLVSRLCGICVICVTYSSFYIFSALPCSHDTMDPRTCCRTTWRRRLRNWRTSASQFHVRTAGPDA